MNIESRIAGIVSLGYVLSGCGAVPSDGSEAEQAPELPGETADTLRHNALSPAQERTALKLIDAICGDTWCEGDNDFSFDSLRCSPAHGHQDGNCTLRLQILPRDDADPPRSFARSCTTDGFQGFDSLVATAPNGYQSLQPGYYQDLTECIGALEAALPR